MGRSVVLVGRDASGKSWAGTALGRMLGTAPIKTPGRAWDAQRRLAEDLTPYGRYCFYASAVTSTILESMHLLDSGDLVFDRGIQCTAAFHHALGVEIPPRIWEALKVPEPTLTVHLTVSSAVAQQRIAARPAGSRPDRRIEVDEDLQLRVVQAYRDLFYGGDVPAGFRPIEISTDGKTPDDVAREILTELNRRSPI